MKVDLTVLAIPGFIGAMVAEYAWQRAHPAAPGEARAGNYELRDTIASLTMGVGSLAAPYVSRRLLDPLTPGVGRGAKALIVGAVLTSAATTALDVIRRRRAHGPLPEPGVVRDEDRPGRTARADRLTTGMALAAVGALWWWRDDDVQALVVAATGLVLLVGGWRHLGAVASAGRRDPGSDAVVLSRLTGIPTWVWLGTFGAVHAGATWAAGVLLLGLT